MSAPRCIAGRDGHQCQHDVNHAGTHYALVTDDQKPTKKRSVKWASDDTTHLVLGNGEHIPTKTAIDAMRSYRMYVLEVQKIALQLGITAEEAERLVQAEKEKYLANQEAPNA